MTLSFRLWLAHRPRTDSPIGDLIRDLLSDPRFTRDPKTEQELCAHLRTGTAHVRPLIRELWLRFERDRERGWKAPRAETWIFRENDRLRAENERLQAEVESLRAEAKRADIEREIDELML